MSEDCHVSDNNPIHNIPEQVVGQPEGPRLTDVELDEVVRGLRQRLSEGVVKTMARELLERRQSK